MSEVIDMYVKRERQHFLRQLASPQPNWGFINSLEGWCSIHKAQQLFRIAIESDSQISIELGVFGGRSLIPIALAHKAKSSGFVLGIDAWNKEASTEGSGAFKEGVTAQQNDEWWSKVNYPAIHAGCIAAIDKYALNDYCGTVRMRTLSVGTLLKDNSIDLLHQDSNHSEEISCAEVELYFSKMKEGSYWVSDDTDWTTTQKSQELLMDKGFTLIGDYGSYKVFQKI